MLFTDRTVEQMTTADTLTDLVQKAKEQPEGSPLALEPDTMITFEGNIVDRATLLVALVPSGSLTDDLQERMEEIREDTAFTDISPIDAGITVNGVPWGWIPTKAQGTSFALIPFVAEPKVVASFNAWQSGSMTGAVENWAVQFYGEVPVLCHEADESEPEATFMEPIYAPLVHDALLALVTSEWTLEPEAPCPVCADEGESWGAGWVTTLTDDGTFSEDVVGTALARVWMPCAKHAAEDVTIDNDGDTWRWADARWALIPSSLTNQ